MPEITKSLKNSLWATQMASLNGLFIVATALGHREDMTLRALTTLVCADAILSEDTRNTRQLLSVYDIQTPCYSYHGHNEKAKLNGLLHLLEGQKKLALVSDRGTPLICDPGWILVQACHAKKIPVHGLPGPCSPILALTLSGFKASDFYFQGFIPRAGHTQWLEKMDALTCPLVMFESPHRLVKTLGVLAEFWPTRQACLLRELTKKFEERVAMTLPELASWAKSAPHLGECVLVIEEKTRCKKIFPRSES